MSDPNQQLAQHILVMGPKGSGKSVLCQKLAEDNTNIIFVNTSMDQSSFESGKVYLHEVPSFIDEKDNTVFIPPNLSMVLLTFDLHSYGEASDVFEQDYQNSFNRVKQLAPNIPIGFVETKMDMECEGYKDRHEVLDALRKYDEGNAVSDHIEQVSAETGVGINDLRMHLPILEYLSILCPKKELNEKSTASQQLIRELLSEGQPEEEKDLKVTKLLDTHRYKHVQLALDHLEYEESGKQPQSESFHDKASVFRGRIYRDRYQKQKKNRLSRIRLRVFLGVMFMSPSLLLLSAVLWKVEKYRDLVQKRSFVGTDLPQDVFLLNPTDGSKMGTPSVECVMSRATARRRRRIF